MERIAVTKPLKVTEDYIVFPSVEYKLAQLCLVCREEMTIPQFRAELFNKMSNEEIRLKMARVDKYLDAQIGKAHQSDDYALAEYYAGGYVEFVLIHIKFLEEADKEFSHKRLDRKQSYL